jgi:hypothetical protein
MRWKYGGCYFLWDIYISSVPDDFKVNPGAVEAIAVHPTNPDKVNTL